MDEYGENPWVYQERRGDTTKEETPEERKKKRALLIALVSTVIGAGLAAAKVVQLRKFRHAELVVEPLKDRWEQMREKAIDPKQSPWGRREFDGEFHSPGRQLLDGLSRLREDIEKHNQTRSWLDYDVDFHKIVPGQELSETLRETAKWELKAIAEFSPTHLRGEGAGDYVQNLCQRMSLVPQLAEAGGLTTEDLLREFGGEKEFQQLCIKKVSLVWAEAQEEAQNIKLIREVRNRQAQARAKRAKDMAEQRKNMFKEDFENDFDIENDRTGEMSQENNTEAGEMTADEGWSKLKWEGPRVPHLIRALNDITRASGVPREKIVSDQDIEKILVPEIWDIVEQLKAVPEHGPDIGATHIAEIVELAQLAKTTPEQVIGEWAWRKLVGPWAGRAAQECADFDKRTIEPRWNEYKRELWQRVIYLLKVAKLKPSDPEVKIPPTLWQEMNEKFGEQKPVPEKPAAEPEKQSAIQDQHRTGVAGILAKVRQDALLLGIVVTSGEAVTITVSYLLDFSVFAGALTSLAVTVKLAQLTGNILKKVFG